MARNLTGEGRVGRGLTDTVYVDVDGTLLLWPGTPGGVSGPEGNAALAAAKKYASGATLSDDEIARLPKVNGQLVVALNRWRKNRPGGQIVVWTMGGREHAEMAAIMCGLYDVICMAKPDIVIDDGPEGFIRKMPVVQPAAFQTMV